METEIYLEATQPEIEKEKIDERLRNWHAEGAEIRYDKQCFGSLTVIEAAKRYRIELGDVDPILAIRELHAMLYHFGVRVFVHFSR